MSSSSPSFTFAIIGSGMIAGVMARAIQDAPQADLVAVTSRRAESARDFAREHGIGRVFETWQELLAADGIDAVYVATPTAVREEIALAVLDSGRHLISEKPFLDAASAERLAERAMAKGLAFMDATHFTHHPRTQEVIETQRTRLGHPGSVNTSFFFPFMDRDNIRFDPAREPTGAIGDMGWYNMRAIVEFLRPHGAPVRVAGQVRRDKDSGAVIRGAGLMVFADGQTSTFDFGYDAGVCQMDLTILGEHGLIRLDDYVLDWKDGFAFDHPEHPTGFVVRQEMAAPHEFERHTSAQGPRQAVQLVEHFVAMAQAPDSPEREQARQRAVATQRLVDAFVASVDHA